jgi:hypothetical protein
MRVKSALQKSTFKSPLAALKNENYFTEYYGGQESSFLYTKENVSQYTLSNTSLQGARSKMRTENFNKIYQTDYIL